MDVLQEDVKEWEHCQHCLNLFPLDEIVNHSMICSHKSTSAKSVRTRATVNKVFVLLGSILHFIT